MPASNVKTVRAAGRVASLHIHPKESGEPMLGVDRFELRAAQGIVEDKRYFGRKPRDPSKPWRRQLTLMEREQIAEHAAVLGLPMFAPGTVRSNIETEGIDLVPWVGRQLRIGATAVVAVYAPRDPCQQMDDLAPGLKELMRPDKQGVLTEILQSGWVQVGDVVEVIEPAPSA